MPIKVFWLHSFPNASRLGIIARPRGGDWLEDEIVALKKQNVRVLVSLLERSEISELGLQEEEGLCSKHQLEYLSFPIPDRSIPSNEAGTQHFVNLLIDRVNKGSNVVIHCRMGIGRSSIIAGRVLLHAGFRTSEVFPHISKVRGLSVPDTEEQIAWLKSKKKS